MAAGSAPRALQQFAASLFPRYGWSSSQLGPLVSLWNGESGWRWNALNGSSGAYGIPQALPASKMATAGADWRTNPATQIRWGESYIASVYGSPAAAWSTWLSRSPHWYANGGTIPPNTTFTVGERGFEGGVSDSQGRVSIFSNAMSRAMGFRSRTGYAGGSTKTYTVAGGGLDKVTYSTLSAAQAEQANMLRKLNRLMRSLTDRSIPKLSKSLGKTGADVKSAFSSAVETLKELGASREALHKLTREDNKLAHLVDVRNRDEAKLASLRKARRTEIGSIRGAVTGSFDIATAGTGPSSDQRPAFGSIFAQAVQDKNLVKKWAAGLRKLAKVFGRSGTGKAMLRRLAEAGPDSYPQVAALAAANPKQLLNLVATERQISAVGQGVGRLVGGELFNDRIRGARRDVASDRHAVLHEFRLLRHDIVRELRAHPTEVTIKLNDKVIATAVATGTRKNERRGGGR
ncbi:MAG TPA: hypothetical protein VE441_00110 [Mycobacterium sp.]|nr:hypothetical protein [Mycobacterium sp.]